MSSNKVESLELSKWGKNYELSELGNETLLFDIFYNVETIWRVI